RRKCQLFFESDAVASLQVRRTNGETVCRFGHPLDHGSTFVNVREVSLQPIGGGSDEVPLFTSRVELDRGGYFAILFTQAVLSLLGLVVCAVLIAVIASKRIERLVLPIEKLASDLSNVDIDRIESVLDKTNTGEMS